MREDLEKDYRGGEGVGTRLVWEMVEPKIAAFESGLIPISVGDCIGSVEIQ